MELTGTQNNPVEEKFMLTKEELWKFTKRYNHLVGYILFGNFIVWCVLLAVYFVIDSFFAPNLPEGSFAATLFGLATIVCYGIVNITVIVDMVCLAVKSKSTLCRILTVIELVLFLGYFLTSFVPTNPHGESEVGALAFLCLIFLFMLSFSYNRVFRRHQVTPSVFIRQKQLDMAVCSDSTPD